MDNFGASPVGISTVDRMLHRRLAPPLALVLIAGLTACSPAASPDPTPTYRQFASEEEAFEAAEDTLRGYVDAANGVDLSEPSTFDASYSWTVQDEYETQREQLTQMHSLGWRKSGATRFDEFVGLHADLVDGTVTATACIDVSAVRIVDGAGTSVVPADRPLRQLHALRFVPASKTNTGLAVAGVDLCEGQSCAQ